LTRCAELGAQAAEREAEMELEKIRNLSDEELQHQVKSTAEQLFRLRFQVSMGQNDGVKKLRQLRKEIAQIKTVAKERELGIRGAAADNTVAAETSKGAR
jgi:large subunit ribosomal protein L29